MEAVSFVILGVLIFLFSLWYTGKRKNTLPGPFCLPIVGYIPFMTKKPHVKLTELSKTYGPVYGIRLGSIDVVVLCDYKLTKEAFASDAFMGRPPDLPFQLSQESIETQAFVGMPWKQQRRFSLHMLRDLGFGKTKMEDHMKEEIQELIELLSHYDKKTLKMSTLLAPSTSNNIASLVFGRRLKFDDPERQMLDRLLTDVGRLAGAVSWQLFFPWLEVVTKKLGVGFQGQLVRLFDEVKVYVRKEVTRHEATLDPNNVRDFIDSYLLEIQKRKDEPNTTFQKEVLVDLARAFFGAGSETIRITLDWLFLLCASRTDVQARVQAEIEEVLGSDRFPTGEDRLRMPYTEAVIMELMRWVTIVPLNLMRYTLQDTELNGHFIPKHTRVLAVLYAMDHDPKLWGSDVHEFKPERFLSPNQTKTVRPEYFMPFSIGKRQCPGKTLAEVEVFLYFTAILQKFELSMPPGVKADFEGILGIGLQPKRQDICLKLR